MHTPPRLLLTPGPLSTAPETRRALADDWGSWDDAFRELTRHVCQRLVEVAFDEPSAAHASDIACVPMQGSGTFAVEAMLGSLVPRGAHVLVLVNGAYGARMQRILQVMGRQVTVLDQGDWEPPSPERVAALLDADSSISDVAMVHCETTSGVLNPVEAIAALAAARGRRIYVDAMSSFGALTLDPRRVPWTGLAASANKCLEGVPGMGFVLARRGALEASRGNASSLSLDLHDQWTYLERTGQWRFTPPTHVVAALRAALALHQAEGGSAARAARYCRNHAVLVAGLRALGLEPLVPERLQSPIIVSFLCPDHPRFSFDAFYRALHTRGFVIYPGKLTRVDTFRVGCIGHLFPDDLHRFVRAVADVLGELGVAAPTPPRAAPRPAVSPSTP